MLIPTVHDAKKMGKEGLKTLKRAARYSLMYQLHAIQNEEQDYTFLAASEQDQTEILYNALHRELIDIATKLKVVLADAYRAGNQEAVDTCRSLLDFIDEYSGTK